MTRATTINPREFAARFGIGKNKACQMIRDGELNAVDVSSYPGQVRPRYRISEQDIEDFIARRSTRPPT